MLTWEEAMTNAVVVMVTSSIGVYELGFTKSWLVRNNMIINKEYIVYNDVQPQKSQILLTILSN